MSTEVNFNDVGWNFFGLTKTFISLIILLSKIALSKNALSEKFALSENALSEIAFSDTKFYRFFFL